jgi:hypothetical protein
MFGEWLSLVEHLVRDQGVGGSNPLSPTIFQYKIYKLKKLGRFGGFFHACNIFMRMPRLSESAKLWRKTMKRWRRAFALLHLFYRT